MLGICCLAISCTNCCSHKTQDKYKLTGIDLENATRIQKPKRIVFFGDSITAFRGELNVASMRLAKEFPDVEMINAGVGGHNTNDGRSRFQRDVLDKKPDVVFFSFGTNDAAIDTWKQETEPRIDLDTYLANLLYFAQEIRKIGAIPVFFTPPPMFMTEKLAGYYNFEPYISNGFNFVLERYIPAAKALLAKENVVVFDIYSLFMEKGKESPDGFNSLLLDGMHPNDDGQKIIADEMLKFLSVNALLP